jgi:hypothetical protein
VWTEAQTVVTRNGVFNAVLGKAVPLPASFNTSYWMSLKIGADPEASPRLEMTGVCYSLHSAVADSARNVANGSVGTAELASAAVTTAKLADGAATIAKMSASGSASGQVPISNGSTVAWGRAGLVRLSVSTLGIYSLPSINSTPTKIGDLMTFTKTSATSVVEVLYDGRLTVESMTSGSGAVFQIRIDNVAPATGSAKGTVGLHEAGFRGISAHITGIFTGLSAGSHTVSIWVYQAGGVATDAHVNGGDWGAQLVVKEID